jgi:hypothetical protein
MIFWILVGFVVISIILSFVYTWGYWEIGAMLGAAALILVALIGSVVTPPEPKFLRTETFDLQALGTRESSAGHRYFLTPGYGTNGQPGFNYLREDENGNYVMRFAQNYQSTIWADEEENPYVDVSYYDWYNPIWVPWNTRDGFVVDLHVPEDSISSEILVAP